MIPTIAMLSEKTFDTGDVALNYYEGPPGGPPVVLLHAFTGRGLGPMTNVAPLLPPRFHVYSLDFRGHGKSGRAPGHYHLLDFARDVAAFTERLSEPAVLIGGSLGAVVALAVAAANPASTRAVILLDPPIYNGELSVADRPFIEEAVRWMYETIQGSPSYEAILARVRERGGGGDEAAMASSAEGLSLLDPNLLDSFLQGRLVSDYDLVGALGQARCPLLLLYGDWDQGAVMRDEDAAFVRAHVPWAVIAKIERGSHAFLLEQPEVVKRHLDAFLAAV